MKQVNLKGWRRLDRDDADVIVHLTNDEEQYLIGGSSFFNDGKKRVEFHSRKGYTVYLPYHMVDYVTVLNSRRG